MYTDDKNAQIVLALLKRHNIKKIVVSPGMTNVPITRSVQIDPWFEVYSVVDERSAAYFACGLAYESGEPVVISCTGATASRNYLPGLTEAFYRHLPIIALTSQRSVTDYGNLAPQVTDRTVSQNDIKKVSVHLPVVKDQVDFERCELSVNKALIAARAHGGGPVHINLPVRDFSFTTESLPEVRKIDYYSSESLPGISSDMSHYLSQRKVAIFIGSHRKFDEQSQRAVEEFAVKYNAAVIIDHTSSYKGKNAILLTQIGDLKQSTNKPDVVIDIGSITGEYAVVWLAGIETWRVSEDGEIHDRLQNQVKLFDCSEESFFSTLQSNDIESSLRYFDELTQEVAGVIVPDLPFSNTYVSYELSRHLPKRSSLHLGILNSLRNMNFFMLDDTIDGSSNVGGFGIDGALSTLIGQSVANRDKLTFGLVGDLAAFYDMNALGIRHIGNNVRILMVNNDGGVEFRLNDGLERQWSTETNEFISARGHNGSMRAWAESMGFYYITATNKDEFKVLIKDFCSPETGAFNKPVFFEVFTDFEGEQEGIREIHRVNIDAIEKTVGTPKDQGSLGGHESTTKAIKRKLKKATPESVKRLYREIRKNG